MSYETCSNLRIKSLSKSYKKRKIIHDISLHFKSGDVVGLLGPNGAGKTTLFYMICGLVQPEKGQVFIDDTELTSLPIHKRAKLGIGYLPQESSIFGKMSVEDNILSILEIHNKYNNKESRLEELINDFSLKHIRKSLGFQLSGGERRRVEIARALAASPKFMLLDEPFAGVDPISISDTKKTITSLATKNIGVVITDHNVHDTLNICNYVYIVSEGYILAEGTPEEVVQVEQVKNTYLGKDFVLGR